MNENSKRHEQAKPNYRSIIDPLDLDANVTEKLSLNLTRIYEGNNDIYLTPMAMNNDPNMLLEELDKVFNSNKSKLNSVLIDLEMSNRAKFGPRSIAQPWKDRRQSLINSFEVNNLDSFDKFTPISGIKSLRPVSLSTAMKLLKSNTNSGLPYYTRKGIVKQRVLDKYDSLIKRKDPCVLFTRTQEQGKTRNVWGYPMADTLNEMRYYSPLLEYQKKLDYRAAIVSPDKVSRSITDLILSVTDEDVLISVDFTLYDNSVKRQGQKVAFNYIKSLFQSQFDQDLDKIAERFCTIGIVTPDGVLAGDHGIPSGSTFTNEVGSIFQSECFKLLKLDNNYRFQVQGDDGAYKLPKYLVDKFFSNFRILGLDINEQKSYISDNYIIYLQNLYHLDYLKDGLIGGIYPIYRALNRILYQERWSDFEDYGITGKDYYSIRTICIVENCKYHPLFQDLVKFILKYDKYSLEFSDQGLASYVQMISKSQGAAEILKNQYGDDVSGIKSFETYKLIKGLG